MCGRGCQVHYCSDHQLLDVIVQLARSVGLGAFTNRQQMLNNDARLEKLRFRRLSHERPHPDCGCCETTATQMPSDMDILKSPGRTAPECISLHQCEITPTW